MNMRNIKASDVQKTVEDLCVRANTVLRPDVVEAFRMFLAESKKESTSGRMLDVLLENAEIAEKESIPLCQDTGMVAVFVEMGRDVYVDGEGLTAAINSGVEKAYKDNYFRKSVESGPLTRVNTDTNTPAVLHVDLVDGDGLTISVLPKGFGSENKSRIAMLNPTCTADEIAEFCVETVQKAGPDACPPYVLGVGLGGTMDQCAMLAKKALLRPIHEPNPDPKIAALEKDITEKANALDIGVMGLGGLSTVMGVNIIEAPTHIAGCPVAVNISCHALRSATGIL